MMAKFVLILYVPGIPALSMSDIDFDFGGVWPKEIIKSNRDCLYVLVRNVTLLLLLLLFINVTKIQCFVCLRYFYKNLLFFNVCKPEQLVAY